MIDLTTLTQGMTNYIDVHNANYAALRAAINVLEAGGGGGGGGSSSVPSGLAEIFDRAGIIGKASYKPPAGTLTGPSYYLAVPKGAYWDSATYYSKTTTTSISMSSKTTGTYYLVVDAAGTPLVQSYTSSGKTLYQFDYNSSTHVVSNVALYGSLAILFDGDDYADQLTSAILGVAYESVAERFEAIEAQLGGFGTFMAEDAASHSGLNFAYKGGYLVDDNGVSINVRSVAPGTIALTDNSTNYIMVDPTNALVSKSTGSFSVGKKPLFVVVTLSGAISTVTDVRTWCFSGGSGGGGHTQNTDTGTTETEFVLNNDASGSPSDNCALVVERGSAANVKLRWNETSDRWEVTYDGTNYEVLLTTTSANLADQQFTKYVGFTDPVQALEDLARDSSVGYETIDLSGSIPAAAVQAVILGVQFWDDVPDSSVNVKFATPFSGDMPALAFTVWSNMDNMAQVVIPLDINLDVNYSVSASGTGTANIRVFLIGYMQKVTGVGSQPLDQVYTGKVVAGSSSQTFDITSFAGRGLVRYLKVEETGGLVSGTYDIAFYGKDTYLAADLLYQATSIDPSTAFTDNLPWWVEDFDLTRELHMKITNSDAAQATFTVTVKGEAFG